MKAFSDCDFDNINEEEEKDHSDVINKIVEFKEDRGSHLEGNSESYLKFSGFHNILKPDEVEHSPAFCDSKQIPHNEESIRLIESLENVSPGVSPGEKLIKINENISKIFEIDDPASINEDMAEIRETVATGVLMGATQIAGGTYMSYAIL